MLEHPYKRHSYGSGMHSLGACFEVVLPTFDLEDIFYICPLPMKTLASINFCYTILEAIVNSEVEQEIIKKLNKNK